MKILRRVLLAVVAVALLALGAFVLLVGPWPTYSDSRYESASYFKEALAAIDTAAAQTKSDNDNAPLLAGWAERDITPEPGHPMAGYGGRPNEMRATGIHEPLFVRALALHDGNETVVFIGSDMLQTLPNLLELIEPRIKERASLTNRNVMYTSSHTHCGPGGLAPGLVSDIAFGPYTPEYVELLAERFAEAIVEAVENLAPARFAHGSVQVPDYIRNRARSEGDVDATLHVAVAEHIETEERLFLARYSAHATVYSQDMLAFNNDYAGAFQRAIKERTGAPLLFMAGAVGSMRPNPPGPPMPEPWTPELELAFEHAVEGTLVHQGKITQDEVLRKQEARAEAMGAALADRLLEAADSLRFETEVPIATMEVFYQPPPAQVRPVSTRWRLSPFAFRLLGVPTTGRLQAARVGDMLLVGTASEISGEISAAWQQRALEHGINLWVTSFSGAYLGYLSPDRYYDVLGEGMHYNHNYEIGQMNWFGPNQEAFLTDLVEHTFHALL